jgi:hypothetical protein
LHGRDGVDRRTKHTDARDQPALLRAHRERPHRRAAEERDELATLETIKLHAVSSSNAET